MAKSVRKLMRKGDVQALMVFGSAGGQHACGIANKLKI